MKTETEIMESVTDLETACKELNIDISEIIGDKTPTNARQAAKLDRDTLDVIAEALQQGFKANYAERSQLKWFPVFEPASSSGFVFMDSFLGSWYAFACGGVRQVFQSKKISNYYAKQFLPIHKRLILNDYPF